MSRVACTLAVATLAAFAGCGGDGGDKPDKEDSACADVPEANSGRGATDIEFEGLSCEETQKLLADPVGLVKYDCESIEKSSDGERFSCTAGSHKIVFTTRN